MRYDDLLELLPHLDAMKSLDKDDQLTKQPMSVVLHHTDFIHSPVPMDPRYNR